MHDENRSSKISGTVQRELVIVSLSTVKLFRSIAKHRTIVFTTMFLRGFSKVGFETLRSVAMSRVSSMLKLVKRLPGCSPVGNNSGKGLGFELRKFAFNLSGYNKYGLYTCDVIDESDPIVAEALRRLPKNVLEYRTFRYHLEYNSCVVTAL